MINFKCKLIDEMEKNGIFINGDIDWGNKGIQRFSSKNGKNNKKNIFLILFENGAYFGDWRNHSTWQSIFESSSKKINLETKKKIALEREKERKEQEAIKKENLKYVFALLNNCQRASSRHLYIINKKIVPCFSFQYKNTLILPIKDINKNLISAQYIDINGSKLFAKGCDTKNGMVWLCDDISNTYNGDIFICEGYATGCSIYEIINQPVICSLSASNLYNVALEIRKKYIFSKIHVCSDNDCWGLENIGLKSARFAVKIINGQLHYPIFDKELYKYEKPTDFNDFFKLFGSEKTRKEILMVRD